MGKPNPPSGGNSDGWTWVAAWILSVVAAFGGGVALGEAGKEREFREKIRKQREKENEQHNITR